MTITTFDFEGQTVGTNVTAGSEGFTSISGGGTAVYAEPGLGGTAACAFLNGTRSFNITTGFEWGELRVKQAAPPAQEMSLHRFNASVGGSAKATLTLRTDGTVCIEAGGGIGVVDESELDLCDGEAYTLTHHFDDDGSFQECIIRNAAGVIVDELSGAIDPATIVEQRFGIITSTVTHTMNVDEIRIADEALAPPIVEDIIAVYDFEGGAAGANITTTTEPDADSISGAGTGTHEQPGLDDASPTLGRLTGPKQLVKNVTDREHIEILMMRAFPVVPTDPADIVRLVDALGETQSEVTIRPGGNVRLTSPTTQETSTATVCDGETVRFLLRWDALTGRHSLRIAAKNGSEIQTLEDAGGTQPITAVRVGNVDVPNGWVGDIDDVTIAGSPLSIPGPAGLTSLRVGGVTSHEATVYVRTTTGTQARIVIAGVTTAAVTLDADLMGMVDVSLDEVLAAGQQLTFDVEINTGGTWAYAGSGMIPFTAPVGTPATFVILAEGCHGSKDVDGIGTDDVWAEAMSGDLTSGIVPRHQVKLGDEGYPNLDDGNDVDDHIAAYEEVEANHRANAAASAVANVVRKFSDHDRAQGNTYFHGPAILESIEAWEATWPHKDLSDRLAAAPECSWQESYDGRVAILSPDDRSNYRSDPEAAEGPLKSLLGTWQDDRLFAILDALPLATDTSDDAPIQAAVVLFDMILTGDTAEFTGKKYDAIPNYVTWRTRFYNAIAGKRVVVVCGDTHHLFKTETPDGNHVLHCAGMQRNTGNLKIFVDGVLPHLVWSFPEVDPDDGSFTNTKTRSYGLVKITDTGPSMTIEMIARDWYSDITHRDSQTWATHDPFGGVARVETFSVDGVPMTDRTRGRVIEAGSVRRVMPGVDVARVTIPAIRGVRIGQGARHGPGYIGWDVWVYDDGGGSVYDQVEDIAELLGNPVAHTVGRLPYPGAVADKEAIGWHIAAIPEDGELAALRRLPMLFEIPAAVWRGVSTLVWSKSLAQNFTDEPVSALAGSTADTIDGLWLAAGPLRILRVYSDVSGDSVRWNPPAGAPIEEVLDGEYLLINPSAPAPRAEILTAASWNFGGGVDVSSYLSFAGEAVLRLRPVNRVVKVRVEAVGKEEGTRISYQGRPTYLR